MPRLSVSKSGDLWRHRIRTLFMAMMEEWRHRSDDCLSDMINRIQTSRNYSTIPKSI